MAVSILAVAEKPSVAREMALIIGNNHASSRRVQSSTVHEVKGCEFRGRRANMTITAVAGHFISFDFPREFKEWENTPQESLFTAPLETKIEERNQNLKHLLVAEARKHDVLFLWLDCDLEGEAICFEVMDVCLESNPRMEVFRAKFSSLSHRDITRAMRFPDKPNKNMSDSVKARSEIDLRIGAAFTRMQTLYLRKYPQLAENNAVITYGPCQFPTLGFVVEQHNKIQSFIPENFWSLTLELENADPDEPDKKMTTSFTWDRGHIFDKFICICLYEQCMANCIATVKHCNERPTSRIRPVPLNLIALQKLASTWFRLSGEDTLNIAQKLYQEGILSYPRTETNFFAEDIELQALLGLHREHNSWGAYTRRLLDNGGFVWPLHGGQNDEAHPPIHPIKSVPLESLDNENERNIYELVTKHFLACCSKDAIGSQTDVVVQVPNNGEIFRATGLMVIEKNWLEIYRWEKWNTKRIPLFRVNDQFIPRRLMMTVGTTTAPQPLSESDLIAQMDANGIGTDATIASHISTIIKREFARKDERGMFHPTDLGKGLVEGYNRMGHQLARPYLRRAMEQDAQKVARGELTREQMVDACLTHMRQVFVHCKSEIHFLDETVGKYFRTDFQQNVDELTLRQGNFSRCGTCGQLMDIKVKPTRGNFEAKYLVCRVCKIPHAVPSNGDLSAHAHTCPICNFQVLTVNNRETGKSWTVCPKCFKDPPPPPISIEDAGGTSSGFRCFQCANSACALSKRTVTFAPCPERNCTGRLKINKFEKTQKYAASCDAYPNCKFGWYLPGCVRALEVSATATCARCAISKLDVKIQLSAAPPGVPPECLACPYCDKLWGDLLIANLRKPDGNGNSNSTVSFATGSRGGVPMADYHVRTSNYAAATTTGEGYDVKRVQTGRHGGRGGAANASTGGGGGGGGRSRLPCFQFQRNGTCTKGDACTFSH